MSSDSGASSNKASTADRNNSGGHSSLVEELKITIEKKKNALKMKQHLEGELVQRLAKLSTLSLSYCKQKQELGSMKKQQSENNQNRQEYEKRLQELEKQQQINQDNNLLLMERKNCLGVYQTSLHQIYRECYDKYKKIDVLNTVINSKRRLCCYQLCTIFFDQRFTAFLFLNSIQRVFNKYEQVSSFEEKINAALGYYALLVQQIAEIYDITLRHRIIFKGCRTQVQRENTAELHNLYFLKKEDSRRLQATLYYFIQNIFQIFEVLNFDKSLKQADILYLLNVISQFICYGEVSLVEP